MYGMTFGKPRPLTINEIKELVKAFAYAAKVLYEAGADGAQLHCARESLSRFNQTRF
jgi:2,4-dienoyl-CoA reductase-like NADH-dependent reductase (Old Yellow Enzyme family)